MIMYILHINGFIFIHTFDKQLLYSNLEFVVVVVVVTNLEVGGGEDCDMITVPCIRWNRIQIHSTALEQQ